MGLVEYLRSEEKAGRLGHVTTNRNGVVLNINIEMPRKDIWINTKLIENTIYTSPDIGLVRLETEKDRMVVRTKSGEYNINIIGI